MVITRPSSKLTMSAIVIILAYSMIVLTSNGEIARCTFLQTTEVTVQMASNSQLFGMSYRTLLASITEELGWDDPIYNQIDTEENTAYVLLRRSHNPIAYYFTGPSSANRTESEEDAAEQAVDYLVQKKKVIVDDINLGKRQMYKACSSFYKDKTMSLEFVASVSPRLSLSRVIDIRDRPLGNTTRIVSIDFWKLLLQIVAALKINITEVEDLVYDNDTQVSTLKIIWDDGYNRVSYFIGDCSYNLEEARKSLAKRTICYLESVFGFAVKDANYYGMIYEEMRCGMHRGRYLAAKDKMQREMFSLEGHTSEQVANVTTPEGPEYQINSNDALPPPAKKLKTIWSDAASSSTSKGAV